MRWKKDTGNILLGIQEGDWNDNIHRKNLYNIKNMNYEETKTHTCYMNYVNVENHINHMN